MQLDLASFQKKFAAELASKETKLDILVNNAGIAFHPRHITDDGQEQVMQVNHLSPFLLTNLLLDLLKAAVKEQAKELSPYKRPRRIQIRLEEFEKTSTQKIKRYLYQIALEKL